MISIESRFMCDVVFLVLHTYFWQQGWMSGGNVSNISYVGCPRIVSLRGCIQVPHSKRNSLEKKIFHSKILECINKIFFTSLLLLADALLS